MLTTESTSGSGRRYATAAQKWRAVKARDARADGCFCYGVRSTGIYCRPHCRSRLPRRGNVEFFPAPWQAEAAGYRPCKRCRPHTSPRSHRAVSAVCAYIHAHAKDRITLATLSRQAHLSPYHLQRIFKAALGMTPRQYQAALRLREFKANLKAGASVTSAMHTAGFGSSSRLYDKTASQLGMTPATYRRGGAGTRIEYTIVATDVGRVLLAATASGLCRLALGDDAAALARELRAEFPAANIAASSSRMKRYSVPVREYIEKGRPLPDLPLDLRGTAFQQQVWQALRSIPHGQTRSYGDVARSLGAPNAARAVAGACGRNPVALLVPCHRVVGANGELSGYRWGTKRKKALLEREAESRKNNQAALAGPGPKRPTTGVRPRPRQEGARRRPRPGAATRRPGGASTPT